MRAPNCTMSPPVVDHCTISPPVVDHCTMGKVVTIMEVSDGAVRGASVQVMSGGTCSSAVLNHPVQRLIPL